ncbi:MAG: glycosyltransferase family 9 protein [Janthinobacterium lividum]
MSVPAGRQDAVSAGVKRVLVYRLGSLGDTLIALPSLHLVARSFPHAQRRLLTNFPVSSKAPAAKTVLGDSGLIDSYERYVVGTRNPLLLLALAWRIRRFRPEVLVYLVAARGVAVAERDARFFRVLCGIPRLIGVPLTEDMQCSRSIEGLLEPEAERLARNINALGDAALDRAESWDMRLNPAERKRAVEALQAVAGHPLIAVSVGTKVQAKDWGRDNWHALLQRLAAAYPKYALVLMGAPEESAASEFAADGWRSAAAAGPLVNLCGTLSPRESAAALSHAAIFLGHDSGPMHMAASVGTACVAIFAARNLPRVWFPFGPQHRVLYHQVDCAGCGLETCVEQRKKCLLSITVDEVLTAAHDVLSRQHRATRIA